MFTNAYLVVNFRRDDGIRLEEQFNLSHLKQLMRWFEEHRPSPTVVSTSMFGPPKVMPRQAGLLTLEEFKDMLVKVLSTHQYDDQLDILFTKLDTSCDGYVDWNEFCTYMLLQFRENDYLRSKKRIPFSGDAKIRHIVHNRQETTTRIIAVENPVKYVTVSKEGAICVWDTELHLEKYYSFTDGDDDSKSTKRRIREWVTDALYMSNCRKIAIASTGRDIRFYDATPSNYFQEFHLFSIPDVPYSLDYWYDKENPGGESLLVFGDDHGAINLFYFERPLAQLFNSPFKKQEGVQEIYFQDLHLHSKWVRHQRIEEVHYDIIRKVKYIPDNVNVISASASPKSSLVILDIQRKKKAYVFKLSKGCASFDFNKTLNILVSCSSDHMVRIWNPYVTSKPVAILEGHIMGVVDVVIHETLGQIFSYSRDAVIKAWDIKEHTCLKTIQIKFPSSLLGRLPDFGGFPMHLQPAPNSSLLMTANDYVGLLKVGQIVNPASYRPTTHVAQLCCALYNPLFKSVVTGADDSTITVWDLESGAKSMLFTNAHGSEEITCMTFDATWRRLITGARNGTIKLWNIQNGHNQQQLEAVKEAEVTGIVPLSDKKKIYCVGWSRMIVKYEDSDPDVHTVKADTSWKGGQVHQDDILALAYCPPGIIATASYDGEISVWSLETEVLFRKLRKNQPSSRSSRKPRSSSDIRTRDRLSTPNSRANSRPNSNSNSRPNSRPNSRHRKSHKPVAGLPVPVDKLLFLTGRSKVKGTEAAILISSEAGVLRWWSIYGKKHELGYFYGPDNPDESILALASNQNNTSLVSGDTQGMMHVWSISDYCIVPQTHRVKTRPVLENSWEAHNAAIVSIAYVEHDAGIYLLSASTDHTAKLWSATGHCVGIFGQRTLWNLKFPATWANPPPGSIPKETPPGKDQLKDLDYTEKNVSPEPNEEDPDIEREITIPNIDRGQTLTDLIDPLESSTTLPRMSNKCMSVGAGTERTLSKEQQLSSLKLQQRSQTFTFGTDSMKTRLGSKVDQHLARVAQDRQGRREQYGEVNTPSTPHDCTNRMGMLCCPYQALITSNISDIHLPENLPLTRGMISQGLTPDGLTTDVVRDMDLTYLADTTDPDDLLITKPITRKQSDTRAYRLPSLRRSKTFIPNLGQSSGKPSKRYSVPAIIYS